MNRGILFFLSTKSGFKKEEKVHCFPYSFQLSKPVEHIHDAAGHPDAFLAEPLAG